MDVLITLALADLRARYGRGRAQAVKWLLDPFALVGVYLLLVVFVIDRAGPAPGLSLACAVVPFHLIMITTFNSMVAVGERRQVILNLWFQRALIPASTTITEAVAFGASLVLLAAMMAIYAVAPTVAALWLGPTIAVTLLFALACAYPASLFGVWFPELRSFAFSVVRMLYFVAPGLVALSQIHGRAASLIKLNPLTGIFESYRDALLYGQAPAAWELLYPAGFAVLMLAAFVPLYRREQRHLAKVA
jgi:ABC-type polysaccharide/polyol phosphate export permease